MGNLSNEFSWRTTGLNCCGYCGSTNKKNGLVMANKEQKAKPSGKREPQLTLKEKRAKKAEKKKS
jgi:hypothetical protein